MEGQDRVLQFIRAQFTGERKPPEISISRGTLKQHSLAPPNDDSAHGRNERRTGIERALPAGFRPFSAGLLFSGMISKADNQEPGWGRAGARAAGPCRIFPGAAAIGAEW